MRRYGAEGQRLARLSRGIDVREVDPVRERKSVSAENTFETDIASFRPLEKRLWAAAEEVSDRLKEKHLSGSTITLKLKTSDFRILTRARSLESPTQLADKIFGVAREMLEREINGTRYRLLGVGVSALADAEDADPADLIDHSGERRAAAERAMDRVRGKFGHEAMLKGLALKERDDPALTPKNTKTLPD
jgi:DNA polymerase-4